jgi:ABC-type transport system involved in cytochrome c biogenesis permease subunit
MPLKALTICIAPTGICMQPHDLFVFVLCDLEKVITYLAFAFFSDRIFNIIFLTFYLGMYPVSVNFYRYINFSYSFLLLIIYYLLCRWAWRVVCMGRREIRAKLYNGDLKARDHS